MRLLYKKATRRPIKTLYITATIGYNVIFLLKLTFCSESFQHISVKFEIPNKRCLPGANLSHESTYDRLQRRDLDKLSGQN